MYRAKALGIKLPSDAPTFGNRVLIRDPQGEEKRFASKTREGVFLCWDSTVQGAYVMTTREDGTPTIVSASAPRPWPKASNKEVWHLEKEPDGEGRIWMSNKGRIPWKTPSVEDAVTFEERTLPLESSGIEQRVMDLDTPSDVSWRKFNHRLEMEEESDEDLADDPKAQWCEADEDGMVKIVSSLSRVRRDDAPGSSEKVIPKTAVEESPKSEANVSSAENEVVLHESRPQTSAKGRVYYVNSLAGIEEEAHSEEVSVQGTQEAEMHPDCVENITQDDIERLEGEGTLSVKSSDIEKMSGDEQDIWIKALKEELDSLQKMEVYDDVTDSDLATKYWSKAVRTKKIPAMVVTVKKPLHDGKGGWKAKARVVCCGNFEPGSVGKDLRNRAEVPNTFEMRTLLALGAERSWSIGSLDVKTAFLYADLIEEEDGIVVVQPPALLARLGLVKPNVQWKLKKALYGLRVAPKRWSQKRDNTLDQHPVVPSLTLEEENPDEEVKTISGMKQCPKSCTSECEVDTAARTHAGSVLPSQAESQVGYMMRCRSAQGLWKVILGDAVVGFFLVYVDDVLMAAKTKWILGMMKSFGKNWECKYVGILVNDGESTKLAVQSLVFLSITIELCKGGMILHQHEYLDKKLRQRGVVYGRPALPELEEGRDLPVSAEERKSKAYAVSLKLAQEEVGSLQWLALKTRPDIAAITAICASLQTRDPDRSVKYCREIWKYLYGTSRMYMCLIPESDKFKVRISADASFAPGGDRSRTGVVIRVAGAIVHWSSNRQSGAVFSVHEAELNGAVTGTKVGVSIRAVSYTHLTLPTKRIV